MSHEPELILVYLNECEDISFDKRKSYFEVVESDLRRLVRETRTKAEGYRIVTY